MQVKHTPPYPGPVSDAAERRIRDAIDRGEFDDLPGSGEPLEGLDRPYDPNWWVKSWIEREREDARHAEDLVAIERQARRIWAAPSLDQLEHVMDDIDGRRLAAGLDPLDRDEARVMWRSVKRHRSEDPRSS